MNIFSLIHCLNRNLLNFIDKSDTDTRAVLVFATERKNNVDPRLRSQKKVNFVQLFFAK